MESGAPYGASATLTRVLGRLGPTLLSLEAGRPDSRRIVTSVVLYDPLDPPVVSPGTLVLGAGLSGEEEVAAAVRSFAADGAIALVLRDPVPRGPEVRAAVAETSLSLYGLVRGASWIRVATLVSGALSTVSPDELMLGGPDSGTDLFELANALAALLDAPVSIEDLSNRVVAFSADQSGADEARHRTILSMQAPTDVNEVQRRHGILRRVFASDRPVHVTDVMEGAMTRVAMRVQAGEERLGVVWAAVREPLSAQREQGMAEAARVVALAMLRARLGADAATRLRLGLVSGLLEGGSSARRTAQQLNFAGRDACVLALGTPQSPDREPAEAEAERQRMANALTMYLTPVVPHATAALLGSVVYAVLPLPEGQGGGMAAGIARQFLARLDSPQPCVCGVGTVVGDAAELPASRTAADAALRVLRRRAGSALRVASLDEVQVDHIMLRLADEMAAEGIALSGPLRRLRTYDEEHNGCLVRTLRSWLDAFGDVTGAAAAAGVHKNTFRYRLSRLTEIADVDLGDPDVRFALALQLRLLT